jgi:hypothetical protein
MPHVIYSESTVQLLKQDSSGDGSSAGSNYIQIPWRDTFGRATRRDSIIDPERLHQWLPKASFICLLNFDIE